MNITSACFTRLSMKAEKNWHQNSGANLLDAMRERSICRSAYSHEPNGPPWAQRLLVANITKPGDLAQEAATANVAKG